MRKFLAIGYGILRGIIELGICGLWLGTGDRGSWATAVVRWCPVPTSLAPTPAPLHTLLHVSSVLL